MINELLLQESRPTRSDAVKNRELLLRTAQRLFLEHSVEQVSMSAIAEAAGVGKGTLYRHFSSKGDLCQELLDHEQRDLQERALCRLRSRQDPVGNLRWFVGEVSGFVINNADLLAVTSDGLMTPLAHPAHLWWRQTIRGLLQQTHIEGDLDYTADVLYVLLDARLIQFQRGSLGYDADRIADGLDAVILKLLNKTD